MAAQTQVLGGEAAHLDGFTQPDGSSAFALTLRPTAPAANGPRNVVILVSTAASQTGDFRAESLATLQSTVARLGPNDRVKLVAFDLNATPLTQGFVAPNSPAMAEALTAIQRRTPLGSCDLEKALDTAAKSFADSKAARAVVYIGDGSSRANLLSTDQLDRMINDLVSVRAPFLAFGVGPQIQGQLLGILAARTGGVLVPEQVGADAGTYGTELAQAAHGSVFWPKSVKWPEGMDVYPKTLPPLRSDRDTVVIGTTKSPEAKHVGIDMDGPAGAQNLPLDIPELKSDPRNSYLPRLVDRAKLDDGRTLALVDGGSLATAKREIESGGKGLADLAGEALKGGNLDSAARLADEALHRNPNDMYARSIKDAIAKKSNTVVIGGGPAPAAKAEAAAPAVGGDPGALNLQGDGGAPVPDGAAAANQAATDTALTQQWQKDVDNTINKARSQVSVDPAKAAAIIQNKTNDLTAETALPPEVREKLMGLLHAAAREIKHRGDEITFHEQQRIREKMAQQEMEMTNKALIADQAKTKQLMDRFDSLMAEGRAKLAEEAVVEAEKIVQLLAAVGGTDGVASPCTRCASLARSTTSWRSVSLSRRASWTRCTRPRNRRCPPPTTRPSSIPTRRSGKRSRPAARRSTAHRASPSPARPRRRSKRPSSSPRRSNSWRRP